MCVWQVCVCANEHTDAPICRVGHTAVAVVAVVVRCQPLSHCRTLSRCRVVALSYDNMTTYDKPDRGHTELCHMTAVALSYVVV